MSISLCLLVLGLLVLVVAAKEVRDGDDSLVYLVGGSMSQVERILSQVVEHHLAGCHLVLATTTNHNAVFLSIIRRLANGGQAIRIVEVRKLFSHNQTTQTGLLQGLWGEARTTCRALILYMGATGEVFSFKFLEVSGLWLQPEIVTVVIGRKRVIKTIVHHASLRNTIHMLYLVHDTTRLEPSGKALFRRGTTEEGAGSERVKVFRRCLYCNNGKPGVQFLVPVNMSSGVQWDNLFPEKLQNLMGHRFKVVALDYFPFTGYEKDSKNPDGPVSPLDSLDTRVLNTISEHLNSTYEIREPWDGAWGVPLAGGNWSGIVGTLQHHKADFSLNLTPSPSRMKAISFSIIYSYDPLIILSLKPGPLPRNLALLRPFTGELWIMIIMCTTASSVVLWLLQMGWSWVSGQRRLKVITALFQSWGVLLQEPSANLPTNSSGQVFLGLLYLAYVIIGTAYHSSLVAHLSVQSMFPSINIFEDLLKRDSWTWGIYPLVGTTFLYFNQSTDPVTQEIYRNRNLQTYKPQEGVKEVFAGGFSYITFRSYIKIETGSRYQDRYGITPFHLSTTEYPILGGGNSWGFRKGAPILNQIRGAKQRLIEAGLIDYWTDDVTDMTVKNNRAKSGGGDRMVQDEVEDGQEVLGLDHLQGLFYLLLLGYIFAFTTLLGEKLITSASSSELSNH